MRAFGYVRLSKEDASSTSPARQRQKIERLCDDRDWKLVQTFSDIDISAFNGKHLVHAGIARQCALPRPAGRVPPCVLISGGETTLTLKGKGKGGRNTEFLLALAIALNGMLGIHALAGDTDGIDGSEDNAGAIHHARHASPRRESRPQRQGHARRQRPLDLLHGIGDLLVTGPTLTNVNDFSAVLIEKP